LKVLETDRLVLRDFSPDDAGFMLRLLNEPSFLHFIGDRGVRDLEQARQYIIDRIVSSYEQFGFGLYMVELADSQEEIGTCGLIKREGMKDVEIGFAFLPEFWSRGYAVESAKAVMDYARRDLDLERVVAIANPDNERSFRLLEKIGLRFERMIQLSEKDPEIKLFTPYPHP
jgi:ribosomal-protein-alanine N-acetyltransferase